MYGFGPKSLYFPLLSMVRVKCQYFLKSIKYEDENINISKSIKSMFPKNEYRMINKDSLVLSILI